MKGMGMDRMVMISRPDKKVTYTVYPGLQAYVEMPLRDSDAAEAQSDFKVETAELGKETVDGHPCVKNRAVVTDKEGRKHESLVWNATDLKNFPIRIEQTEQDTTMTMLFKEIELSEPDVSLFDPPTDFKHYESMPALMQQEMMKRMGGGAGFPRRK